MKVISIVGVLFFSFTMSCSNALASNLNDAVDGNHRSEAHKARDKYRNPKQTLEFFGIRPDMTVVEIWPGGSGWYTEILAPMLKDKGQLVAAHFDKDAGVQFYTNSLNKFIEKFSDKSIYGDINITAFNPPNGLAIAEPESADLVLTFRNVHNWYMRGEVESIKAAFGSLYKALKPGGVLGIVEHRLPASRDKSEQKSSGYMQEDFVIKWAEEAGFKLVAKSEINANPADTANHPRGVWTLPPRLRLGDENRDKYLAIGESDRMTLKFVRPK